MFLDWLRGFVWTIYLRLRGARVGRNLLVHGSLDILLRDGARLSALTIGDDVTLGNRVYFRIRKKGQITVASNVRIGTEVWLVAANESKLSIGENTALGSYGIYNGGYGVDIGSDCLFAGFVYINSSDHRFSRAELIRKQGHVGARVSIGNDVWVGGHVAVTQGVCIGEGSVIGVNSVVRQDIPPYAIAVGTPARVVKYRT